MTQQANQLGALWSYLPLPIIWLSPELRIQEINTHALKLYQWKKSEVEQQYYLHLCAEQSVPCPLPADSAVILAGETVDNIETVFNTLHGEKTIMWKINLFKDQQENDLGYILIGEDVTALRREQEKTYELDNIIGKMPVNAYWYNREGVYLGCNENAATAIGMSRVEALGKNTYHILSERMPKAVYQAVLQDDQKIMQTGEAMYNVIYSPFYGDQGKVIDLFINKIPLADKKGKVYGILGISIDITERTKLEEDLRIAKENAEAANRAKSEFVANMSHDIRTPLSGVSNIAELLLHYAKDAKTQEYCKMLVEASKDLVDLFNGIIDLMRLDIRDDYRCEQFDLRENINKIKNIMLPMARSKGLKLITQCDKKIPHYLMGNRLFIYRILLNLVGNAIKFTAQGEVRIRAILSVCKDKDVALTLVVEDTGIGIPPAQHAKIFEQFSKLDTSYESENKGVGLGLYMVDQYVKKMKGEVHVDSEPGKGSRFTCIIPIEIPLSNKFSNEALDETDLVEEIFLPLGDMEETLVASEMSAAPPNEQECDASIERLSVLLVEDTYLLQQATKDCLMIFNCDVDTASNGKTALAQATSKQYDVILMDVGLPDISGLDVTAKIRAHEKTQGLSPVPIVAVTAHVNADEKKRCLQAGMNEVYSKPLSQQDAQAVLDRYRLKKNDEPELIAEESFFANVAPAEVVPLHKQKIIDVGLAKQYGLDEAKLKDMLAGFVKILPEEMQALAHAFKAENWPELKSLAHKMHGVTCYTATPRLKSITKELEVSIEKGQIEMVDAIYDDFCHEIDLFLSAYKEYGGG